MHFYTKAAFLPLLIVLGILIALAIRPNLFHPAQPTPTPTPGPDDLARSAAIAGTTAFFTIDEQAGRQAWIDGLCQVSTQSGCAFYRLGAEKLWEQFAAAHTSITPTILSAEKVALPESETGKQVWKLAVELSKPLPGRTDKQDEAYALVVLEQGAWKFDRFLVPEEAQGLAQ